MSCKARQKAKLNRERREQEREGEEFLRRHASSPAFLELKAAINGWSWEHGNFKDFLQSHASDPLPPKRRQWGVRRGPRYDPARVLRDVQVAFAVESAFAAGRSYKEAIDLGVATLSLLRSGASSPKTVEAILTKQRRLQATWRVDLTSAQRLLRQYGMDM